MNGKVNIDRVTGLVAPTIYSCYKDTKGRCAVRFQGADSTIECVNEPSWCSYHRKNKEEIEIEKEQTI